MDEEKKNSCQCTDECTCKCNDACSCGCCDGKMPVETDDDSVDDMADDIEDLDA